MTQHSVLNMEAMQKLFETGSAKNGNIIEISHPERRRYKVLPNGNYEPVMIKDPNEPVMIKYPNEPVMIKDPNEPVMIKYPRNPRTTRKTRKNPERGSLIDLGLARFMGKIHIKNKNSTISRRILNIRSRILSKRKSLRCNYTLKNMSTFNKAVKHAKVGKIICVKPNPVRYYKIILKNGDKIAIPVLP